jgi:hypothetical protein
MKRSLSTPTRGPVDKPAADPALIDESAISDSGFRHELTATKLRVNFTVQYTDFGLEALYLELESLRSDPDRAHHLKRVLSDIGRGLFKPPERRFSGVGDVDQPTFRIQISLSTRDVWLGPLFAELTLLKTSFRRNNVVKKRLFEAYNQAALPQASAPSTFFAPSNTEGQSCRPNAADLSDESAANKGASLSASAKAAKLSRAIDSFD